MTALREGPPGHETGVHQDSKISSLIFGIEVKVLSKGWLDRVDRQSKTVYLNAAL